MSDAVLPALRRKAADASGRRPTSDMTSLAVVQLHSTNRQEFSLFLRESRCSDSYRAPRARLACVRFDWAHLGASQGLAVGEKRVRIQIVGLILRPDPPTRRASARCCQTTKSHRSHPRNRKANEYALHLAGSHRQQERCETGLLSS